jgi:hypothetical protein
MKRFLNAVMVATLAFGFVLHVEDVAHAAKVTIKYTEKGGEKTAVAVKDASKATAKAVTQYY